MAKFHKGVWGISDYSEGQDGVARAVERLARAGFSLIIPFMECTEGSVEYHSKIANIDSAFKDWDLLATLAEEAEKAGLKVHPCLDPFRGGKNSPITNENLYERNRFGEFLPWFCPASEEVRKYKLNLYEELMDSYPIAGVHMDHIRYDSEDECFCERCRSEFKKETGIDPLRISRGSSFNTLGESAQSRKHPLWARWVEWRVGWITRFVEELSKLTKKRNKELSAAVFMEYPESIVYVGQDWGDWAERGLIDYVFPMTYTNSTLMVKRRTRNHVAQVRGSCPVWEGLGKESSRSSLSTKALIEQAKTAQEEGAEGIIIFTYKSLTNEDLAALAKL